MKISNISILSLAAATVIIGTHQMITVGIIASYPIFMLSVALLFWYKFRKNKQKEQEENSNSSKKPKQKKR
ncbi:hypothetical protein A33Q_4256 [Indibacter alkaliphilus LW1]|uniref:Uncharacterized protein n=1 Tax=Indibacter alkaliphilus (strain CCUG 57479 / KCTC 22604 / LW1) TaxID=1189612 RepID=S2DQM6_INDAL|nr:hypothetical protein [Indibacter alkaliphilus]EOZ92163.1 hypothetical protein A33Q_4256 [Indibacter alkaliphilus LW1]